MSYLRMRDRIRSGLLVLMLSQLGLAQSVGSMVVGLEGELVRCSGGARSGLEVGERLSLRRSSGTIGWAEVVEVDEYYVWARYETAEPPQVGDRVISGIEARKSGSRVTKHLEFEVPTEGGSGSGFDANSLYGLYGLYSLIDNQRYYNQYSSGFYRTSGNIQLATGVASFLFNQLGRRGPKPRPIKVRFELSLLEQDLESSYDAPVEVLVEIANTGWHDLQFENLDEHVFLLDSQGQPHVFEEMDAVLHDPLKPGKSVVGMMRFPRVDLETNITFAFEDILGEQGELTFQKR